MTAVARARGARDRPGRRWSTVAACLLVASRCRDSRPTGGRCGLLGLAAAALAAAVVAGLRDPAASLLAAMPTSGARSSRPPARDARCSRPGDVALLPGAPGTSSSRWPAGRSARRGPDRRRAGRRGLGAGRRRLGHRSAAGVAAPLLWWAVGQVDGLDPDVAAYVLAWQQHPWLVALLGAAARGAGRNR